MSAATSYIVGESVLNRAGGKGEVVGHDGDRVLVRFTPKGKVYSYKPTHLVAVSAYGQTQGAGGRN